MSPLPPEALEALREAAATRAEITRLVLVERRVEPLSEPAFTDRQLPVVLDEPPTRSPGFDWMRELTFLLAPPLRDGETYSISVPSALAVDAATRDGVVVSERGAS